MHKAVMTSSAHQEAMIVIVKIKARDSGILLP